MYFVMEPIFGSAEPREPMVPKGQADLCQSILQETSQEEKIIEKLRLEYLSIIVSLQRMAINFRIIFVHKDKIDQKVLGACIKNLGCRIVGIHPDFFPSSVPYPRDFTTVLPGLILVNSSVAQQIVQEKDGYLIRISPLGEGGRVLFCQKNLLVSERLSLRDGQSSKPEIPREITILGIRVGLFPPPLTIRLVSGQVKRQRVYFNDHIDREACLIKGKDNQPHLVVNPRIESAEWIGRYAYPSWKPLSTDRTLSLIRKRCEPLSIKVHTPKKMLVPYALNLIQFPDGRVLMTGGDDAVKETIADIVGEENVFCTDIPIHYFPVWMQAGIHCIVSEAPTPLFRPVHPNKTAQ